MLSLASTPNQITGIPFFLQAWKPLLQPLLCSDFSIPIWISLEELPMELWDPTTLLPIAEIFGRPILIDDAT